MKMLLIGLISLMVLISSRVIELPPEYSTSELDVRVDEMVEIKEPDYPFQSVFKKQILEVSDGSLSPFPACWEEGPETTITVTSSYQLDRPIRPKIIYNFQDIKFSQFVLDSLLQQDVLYAMLSDGNLSVVHINDSTIRSMASHKTPFDKLELGYFFVISERIFFANGQVLLYIGDDQIKIVNGYLESENFQTVVALQQGCFMVGDEQKGGIIYRFKNNFIQVEQVGIIQTNQHKKNALRRLSDLAYDNKRHQIMVLDRENGLFFFGLNFSTQVTYQQQPVVIGRAGCHLMFYHAEADQVYLSCQQVYKLSLSSWPDTYQIFIQQPKIAIREIYADGHTIVLVGRNVFRVMYEDRLSAYYEDTLLDQLILYGGDRLLSLNDFGILAGKYTVLQPRIICQPDSRFHMGTHHLYFKTIAECQPEYLKKRFYQPSQPIQPNDRCVYTVYRDIYFWKPGEVAMLPIVIAIVCFIVVGLIIAFWVFTARMRLRALQDQFKGSLLDSNQHQNLNEQQDQKQRGNSYTNEKINDSNKEKEIDPDKYSIE